MRSLPLVGAAPFFAGRCRNMDYAVEIRLLSQKFADDYPEKAFPELMLKHGRPYTCLLIDTHAGYFICVPFRSSISHNTAFLFKNTRRSGKSRSGLDYTKMALIKNADYIDNMAAIVDNDEYVETIQNIERIIKDVDKYISDYCKYVTKEGKLAERDFARRYKYSTLPYFHDILGL